MTTPRQITVTIQSDPADELSVQRLGPAGLQYLAAAAKWAVATVYGIDARPRTVDCADDGVRLTAVVGGYKVTVPLVDEDEPG